MAQTLNTIRNYPGMEEGMTTTALNGAVAVIRENLPVFTEKFQSSNSFGGFYEPTENVEWTTGFWTGSIWLAYEHTGDEAFKKAADIQVESFLERIEKKIDVNHHDRAFSPRLSSGFLLCHRLCESSWPYPPRSDSMTTHRFRQRPPAVIHTITIFS